MIPVKSPLMSPRFLINFLDNVTFRKSKTLTGCELLFLSNVILLQLTGEQIFCEVSTISAYEELFLETKCNSSANLSDRCDYFSDKVPWDPLIPLLQKKNNKIPTIALFISPKYFGR